MNLYSFLLFKMTESWEDRKISNLVLDVHVIIGAQYYQFNLIWYDFLPIQD